MEDTIDPAAGIRLHVQVGDEVHKGDALMTLYADSEEKIDEAAAKLRENVKISAECNEPKPLIHAKYSNI